MPPSGITRVVTIGPSRRDATAFDRDVYDAQHACILPNIAASHALACGVHVSEPESHPRRPHRY